MPVHQERPRRLRPGQREERQHVDLGVPEDVPAVDDAGHGAGADRDAVVGGIGGAHEVVGGKPQRALGLGVAVHADVAGVPAGRPGVAVARDQIAHAARLGGGDVGIGDRAGLRVLARGADGREPIDAAASGRAAPAASGRPRRTGVACRSGVAAQSAAALDDGEAAAARCGPRPIPSSVVSKRTSPAQFSAVSATDCSSSRRSYARGEAALLEVGDAAGGILLAPIAPDQALPHVERAPVRQDLARAQTERPRRRRSAPGGSTPEARPAPGSVGDRCRTGRRRRSPARTSARPRPASRGCRDGRC